MKKMSLFTTLVAAASLAAPALVSPAAADAGPRPYDCESQAIDYVKTRMSNPRGARVRMIGEPYEAEVDFDEYEEMDVWAVDVRVRSRLPSGASTGVARYTVIFVDGEPVALREDDEVSDLIES